MPSSLSPVIAFYSVVDEEETLLTAYDFSTMTVGETTVSSTERTIRIKNESNATDALNPIVYLGGADAQEISDGGWCQIKIVSNNGIEVTTDEFEPVTNNPVTTKEFNLNIEAARYVDILVKVVMPGGTLAGQYDWKLAVKYEYTV